MTAGRRTGANGAARGWRGAARDVGLRSGRPDLHADARVARLLACFGPTVGIFNR